MLGLLSYAVGLFALLSIVACIASGLLKVCDFIEEYPSTARSIGRGLTWTAIVITTIITFTDGMPFTFLLASWLSEYASLCVLRPKSWPFGSSSLLLAVSVLSSVLVHLLLVHHFRHVPPQHKPVIDRTPWPGGRQDWDHEHTQEDKMRLYGNGEALTCFAICWLSALWIAMGAITQNWTLPLAKGQARFQRNEGLGTSTI